MIYLDNAATTQVCPEAAQAALDAMTVRYGNPSSTHRCGREAKKLLDASRASVAKALGCTPEELFFTSGGTESNNWAIRRGAPAARRGKHIITAKTEHDAVLKTMTHLESQGWEITYLSPAPGGGVEVSSVLSALREDTALVSLMLVNNETGAVTDIAAIAKAMRSAGSKALLHTDAVQAFLKLPFSAKSLGADLISVSGHKIHAPKGVGALYVRRGLNLPAFLFGGGQEREKRSGTEAMPQIAAFAAAVETARAEMPAYTQRLEALQQHARERLAAENVGIVLLPGGAPHILSLSLPGYRSEVLMNFLEARDICVSKSSACKKGGRSHVLTAMRLKNEIVDGALRVSFSRFTTREETDAFCDALRAARESLRTSLR